MNHYTKEELIDFEARVKEAWERGDLPYLTHLCGGNEDELISIFRDVKAGDWVFSGHRSHYHYLLSGGTTANLMDKIQQGDSMFLFAKPFPGDTNVNFVTSSVLAGTCCMAVGVAWALKQDPRRLDAEAGRRPWVWCFLGDGAEEQGHFYEAVLYAAGHELPITFVIEDNNRSVDTEKMGRRGVFKGISPFGQGTAWAHQVPWPDGYVRRYQYTPTYPHAGSGCKHKIQFNQRDAGPNLSKPSATKPK